MADQTAPTTAVAKTICIIDAGTTWPRQVVATVHATDAWKDPEGRTTVASNVAGIGWSYDGTTLTPPPVAQATVAQLLSHAQRAFQLALAKGQSFNVAASGQPAVPALSDGTRTTRDDLAELADFGKANAAGTRVWLDNAGATTTLSGAQLVTLDTLVRAWVSATYAAHGTLLAAITAAPPTVTTIALVDAFAWPTA